MTVTEFTPRLRHRILMAIEESGKTQKDIAREMGVSPSVVSRWVKGHRVPDAFDLMVLADVTKAEWLLDLRGLPSGCIDECAVQEPLFVIRFQNVA